MAQTLQELIEDACSQTEGSEQEVHFRNTYSGRGMFGRQCVGITGSWKGCQAVMAEVLKAAFTASVEDDEIELDNAIDTILAFSQDQMGFDVVIYWEYLPPIDSAAELSDREHDGQPDEAQEWHDFNPDC